MKNKLNTTLSLLIFSLAAFGNTVFAQLTLPETKIVAADGRANSSLGGVGIDGNTLVLGASGDTIGSNSQQGSVYIYVRSGTGWTFQQKLTASDGRSGDLFGRAVGISGNTITIGANSADLGTTAANQGAVYVFVRNSNNVWTEQAKLIASDASGGDNLGEITRIDGDTIIAGARLSDRTTPTTQIDSGAAYVFVRNGTTWTQQAKLIANDGVGGDNFGISCDISGDTAVVGAWFDAEGINTNQGSAYIFTRNSAGQWSQQTKILANDGLAGDWFGISSAIDGNTVVVGARQDNLNPGTPGSVNGQGSAYIYTGSGASWTLQQKVTASDPLIGGTFGESCAILGDRIVVGTFNATSGLGPNRGAAYLYQRSGTTWTQLTKLSASDGAPSDFFADFVALGRYDVVSGAYGDDIGINQNQGSAYVYSFPRTTAFDFTGDNKAEISVFRGSTGVWHQLDSLNGAYSAFGWGSNADKLAPADYDGDGRTDRAVFRNGIWYVFRSTDNQVTVFQWGSAGDLPRPGDFNGDGQADFAVFRPSNGTWYIYYSNPIQPGNITFNVVQFGANGDVPILADFDGDGKSDVSVFRNGVWYFIRSGSGTIGIVQFGSTGDVPVAGDYDADGKADLAVFRNGVWYVLRSTDGGATIVGWGSAGDKAVPADYDNDGRSDFAIYRNGVWWILRSSDGGFSATTFGLATDTPIQAAYQ